MRHGLDRSRIRAVEAAELLLADFRDRMTPEQYERALSCARCPVSAVHPEQAAAMLRLYDQIAGQRT